MLHSLPTLLTWLVSLALRTVRKLLTNIGASYITSLSQAFLFVCNIDGYGTIGIAPDIELVAVKVHTDVTGSGPWSWLLQGIYYAVSLEVDVINMSLGAKIPKTQGPSGPDSLSAADIAQMKVAVCGAVTYA